MINTTRMENRTLRLTLYAFVFLSGAASLVYQVVWQKYLSILLGAQARATAIVLAIFLGGISLGYWYYGRITRQRNRNLLLLYAEVELALGMWAILFPVAFQVAFPFTSKILAMWGISNVLIDVLASVLLIGFPTFLMGGTLPLLTQGLSTEIGEASRTHTQIYGYNTLGACFGCLLAGYWLVPSFGLRTSSLLGGWVNCTIGIVSYFAFAKRYVVPPETKQSASTKPHADKMPMALFVIAFLSGFYLIALETILMRLMGLSTGSSHYNFTLIVSIFIFGLGAGSLSLQKISSYTPKRLFWNQLGLSYALIFLYFSADHWPYWVHVVRSLLRDLPENFYLFQAFLGVGFLATLAVPIGFAGATLPLCFHLAKDRKETLGLRVGQLYGVNTLGCLLGALLGGYYLLNFFNLDQLFKICIFLSLVTVLAAGFAYKEYWLPLPLAHRASALLVLAVTTFSLPFFPLYRKERYIQPFRYQEPIRGVTFAGIDAFDRHLSGNSRYILYKDGPNTSVGVNANLKDGKEVSRTIIVNGKSDGNTHGDIFTTLMLGHLPGLLAKDLKRVCVIGFGTGMTAGTFSLYPELERLDLVEISSTIIEHASLFDDYNYGISKNPKLHFHEMDAFRFLGGSKEKFDVILSEPSNPWVTGIENLYSLEFYKMARNKMTDDGLFVQWIHTYSFNDNLFRMVLRTMNEVFPYISIFQLRGGDLGLVGSVNPIKPSDLQRGKERFENYQAVGRSIAQLGLTKFESILALEMIPAALVPTLTQGMPIHTLESPKLSYAAAKAFFVGTSADVASLRRQNKQFHRLSEQSLFTTYLRGEIPSKPLTEHLQKTFCDQKGSHILWLCEEILALAVLKNPGFKPEVTYESPNMRKISSLGRFHRELSSTTFTDHDLTELYDLFENYKRFNSSISRLPGEKLVSRVESCIKHTAPDSDLHGQCLLQRILIFEAIRPSNEFVSAAIQYTDWFPTFPKDSPNYKRLEEAYHLLKKITN